MQTQFYQTMQWANGEILGSEASRKCRIEGGGCVRHVQVLNVVVELCVRQVQVLNVVPPNCSGGTSSYQNQCAVVAVVTVAVSLGCVAR